MHDLNDKLHSSREILAAQMREMGWLASPSGNVLAEGPPRVAIVTGSGLGELSRIMTAEAVIAFEALPALAPEASAPRIEGHALSWVLGRLGETPIHLIAGRRHIYEGIEIGESIASIRLMALLGVRLVILTNAAGGLSPRLQTGNLMLLSDHINLMFRNPLAGKNDFPSPEHPGARFPDMCEAYDPAARAMIRQAAMERKIPLKEGIYAAVTGPNYETRGEAAMLRRFGADAVGMSTVPEAIAARHADLRVAAISVITNSHVHPAPASHKEVLDVASQAGRNLADLLTAALPRLDRLAAIPNPST